MLTLFLLEKNQTLLGTHITMLTMLYPHFTSRSFFIQGMMGCYSSLQCWVEFSECEKFQNQRLLHPRIPQHAWLTDNINYCKEHAKQQSAMQTSYMREASMIRTISSIQAFCPLCLCCRLSFLLMLGGFKQVCVFMHDKRKLIQTADQPVSLSSYKI